MKLPHCYGPLLVTTSFQIPNEGTVISFLRTCFVKQFEYAQLSINYLYLKLVNFNSKFWAHGVLSLAEHLTISL